MLLLNKKQSIGQNFCPNSSLIDLITLMIQDIISAHTYFFHLQYVFSNSVNTLRQNKVFLNSRPPGPEGPKLGEIKSDMNESSTEQHQLVRFIGVQRGVSKAVEDSRQLPVADGPPLKLGVRVLTVDCFDYCLLLPFGVSPACG
jgi:hypothetical protein